MAVSASTRRRGVLIVNLGSPESPSPKDVRRYLRQFLMDPRVLDLPYHQRAFLVYGLILPRHTAKSASHYRSIWTDDGSPLIVHSRKAVAALRERLTMPVALGMRYGHPSIREAVGELLSAPGERVDEILLIPAYPQYAMSSYETALVEARRALRFKRRIRLTVIPPYFEEDRFLDSLVESARPHLKEGFDHLLFSYHNIPARHLHKSDTTGSHCLSDDRCCLIQSDTWRTCYRRQAIRTSELFAARAGVPIERWSIAFQSRFGSDEWLTPETEPEIIRLVNDGVKRLTVICPGFSADCLETIEEIGIHGRQMFLDAGGESFTLIPCLNDHPRWVQTLADWSQEDWPDARK